MSKFFIRRPIVAIVISILMVIVGAITIVGLPVGQFPDIAPPEIRVYAMYPGADAETMERAVATPIEQQVNGVDNMDYMYSLNSTGNSSTALMVDFKLGTDPNTDLILTQSRQQLANGQLPIETNQIGIDVKKALTSPMMLVALSSPNGTYDTKFLTNYAYINLNDPIGRLYGVGLTQVFGGQYAMRIWVKPDRLATLGVTASDVVNAVQAQNTVNPAGQVGGEPSVEGQQFTYAVRAQGRLQTPEEFGDIVVRESADGGVVRVKDVASVELGSQDYNIATRLNGKPAAVLGIYQLPGSNAVEAAKGVRKLMAEMEQKFPADLEYAITLDTTEAVLVGIEEIVHHARDRLRPGDPRRLRLPAGLARDADSHARGAGVARGHLHGVPDLRFLREHAVALRPGAGDRSRRGRRDCRGRRNSAAHRRGPGAEGRRPEGDGRIVRAGDRYRPRPGRGVRADRLHPGHHRQALSAVCHHHRDLRHRLGVQRPDVEPCARRTPAPAASEGSWPPGPVLRLVQPGVRARHQRVPVVVGRDHPQERYRRRGTRGVWGRQHVLRESGADELPARRGPGLPVHPDAAAGGVVHPDHGRSRPRRGRSPQGDAWGRVHHRLYRVQCPQPHPQHLQRVLLGHPGAVGTPEGHRAAVPGDQGEVEPEAPHASAGHRVRLLAASHFGRRHLGRLPVRARRPLR